MPERVCWFKSSPQQSKFSRRSDLRQGPKTDLNERINCDTIPGAGQAFPKCRAKRITSALVDHHPRPHETCEKMLRNKRATAQNTLDIISTISY